MCCARCRTTASTQWRLTRPMACHLWAILEGFSFIGIEREAEYVEIAKARIASAQAQPKQESLF